MLSALAACGAWENDPEDANKRTGPPGFGGSTHSKEQTPRGLTNTPLSPSRRDVLKESVVSLPPSWKCHIPGAKASGGSDEREWSYNQQF